MAMTDEDRLQFAVAQELAAYTQERGPVTEYWDDAESFIAQLRGRGITLTPPPAPEPTYQFPPMTQLERDCLIDYLWAASDRSKTLNTLLQRIEAVGPEPGA